MHRVRNIVKKETGIDLSCGECSTFKELRDNPAKLDSITHGRGVYVVVRINTEPTIFRNPPEAGYDNLAYSIDALKDKWVEVAQVIYIGKAAGEKGLHQRISQYVRYGRGRGRSPTNHKGGRSIWQIQGCWDLSICWIEHFDPGAEEARAILHFQDANDGRNPFANFCAPRRTGTHHNISSNIGRRNRQPSQGEMKGPRDFAKKLASDWQQDESGWSKAIIDTGPEMGCEYSGFEHFYDALLAAYLDASPLQMDDRKKVQDLANRMFVLDEKVWSERRLAIGGDTDMSHLVNRLLDALSPYVTKLLEPVGASEDLPRYRLSIEMSAEYRATVRALLPRYRQRGLDGEFEIPSRLFVQASTADYQPFGEYNFFIIASSLLLLENLRRHGITLPLAITEPVLNSLDKDWRLAVWRLIMGATIPMVIIASNDTLKNVDWELLRKIDWDTECTQLLRLTLDKKLAWHLTKSAFKSYIG